MKHAEVVAASRKSGVFLAGQRLRGLSKLVLVRIV